LPSITSRFVDCHIFRLAPHGSRTPAAQEASNANAAEEWLVLKRAPHIHLGGTWQMVSGHLEAGEKAYECAARELFEETGLRPLHFYQASYVNRFYIAASDEIVLSPVFAAQVPSDAKVRLSDEHTAFEWVPYEEALRRYPWPGQRKAIEVIRAQFVQGTPMPQSCLDDLVECATPSG
jgi:dihydroneopterin triphosphate diphosphatase